MKDLIFTIWIKTGNWLFKNQGLQETLLNGEIRTVIFSTNKIQLESFLEFTIKRNGAVELRPDISEHFKNKN